MTLMRCFRTIVLWFVVLSSITAGTAFAEDQPSQETGGAAATTSYAITGIRADQSVDAFALRILCSGFPTYTMYELFDPLRLMLDVAGASIADSVKLPLDFAEGPVTLIQGQTLADKVPSLVRIELMLKEQRSYSVEREVNDIVITFPNKATVISGIDVVNTPTETRVQIRTNGAVTDYHKAELPSDGKQPARMYMDIKNISFALPEREKMVGTTSLEKIRLANRDNGVRIVFDSGRPELFSYDILASNKGLEVVIPEAPGQILSDSNKKRIAATATDAQKAEGETAMAAAAPEEAATTPPSATGGQPAQPATSKQEEPADNFTVAGYTKQRITVDFYKIDLHNVFRLFGEISGLNIVVDEGVTGSLTLSLKDVPWDFALDVILNLKDLQQEERFNTIVISPKSKSFHWPERQLDSLAVSAEGTPTTVESLSVQKKIETPKEIIDAKRLIKQGQTAEKENDIATALDDYEKAFALWPKNNRLASRMASLYLADEGMNAKAVYYAKEALKIDNNDRSAALFAAIGLANMKKQQAAQEYFDRAVSEGDGTKPAKEALISYAVFNEDNGNYVAALLLLARYGQLYGDSLETMVAKARIYEKEGNAEKALAEYQTILLSGYELPPDLSRYIKGRLAQNKTK
jgi:type IV pilus assembly protein PilQ